MEIQAYWYDNAYVLRIVDKIHEGYLLVQEKQLTIRLMRSYYKMVNSYDRWLIEAAICNGEPTTIEDFVDAYNRTVSHIREVVNPIVPLNPKEPGYYGVGTCNGDIIFKEVTRLGVSGEFFLAVGNDHIEAYSYNGKERNYDDIPAEMLNKFHNTIIDINEWLHKTLSQIPSKLRNHHQIDGILSGVRYHKYHNEYIIPIKVSELSLDDESIYDCYVYQEGSYVMKRPVFKRDYMDVMATKYIITSTPKLLDKLIDRFLSDKNILYQELVTDKEKGLYLWDFIVDTDTVVEIHYRDCEIESIHIEKLTIIETKYTSLEPRYKARIAVALQEMRSKIMKLIK